jgi:tRNA1(Val) A37 N6-methylase TrmN6
MGPSLSSAARACPSPTTTGKALPKRAPASPEAVRAFVRKRAEEFLGVGSEEHVSSSLRRLVRAQTRALERSLDRETDDRLGAGAASEDDVEFGDAASRHRLDGARAHPFPDETLDVLFRRRLLLLQARRGYRCNVDSLLLAAHAAEALRGRVSSLRGHQSPRVADLGAGCGVVGLAVALDRSATLDAPNDDDANDSSPYELPEVNSVNTRDTTTRDTRVLSIERQASLASRCARNAALNGLSRRVEVWRGDVVDVADAARAREFSKLAPWLRSCDAVVVNPPYYEMDSARAAGTQPRETERRDAHYETTATLLDFARAAEALLAPEEEEDFKPETRRADETNETKKTRNAPTAHFVYPAARAASVAAACAAAGLGDVTIKRVFTDERVRASNGDPALALIDARRALRAERDPERDPERRRIEARRADASGVLYADDARRTYGADVETFMENLGL